MCTSFVKERAFHFFADLMLAVLAAFVLAAFKDNAFTAFAELMLAVFTYFFCLLSLRVLRLQILLYLHIKCLLCLLKVKRTKIRNRYN